LAVNDIIRKEATDKIQQMTVNRNCGVTTNMIKCEEEGMSIITLG
jgi:hypothetical protein